MSAPTTHRTVALLAVTLLLLTATGLGVSTVDRTGDWGPAAVDPAAQVVTVTPEHDAEVEFALHDPGVGGWPAEADAPPGAEEPRGAEGESFAGSASSAPDCQTHFGPGPC